MAINKKTIRAFNPKTYDDLGNIEVIWSVDKCRNCEWCVLKETVLPGIEKERWGELYCALLDRAVKGDDYCSWWERVL